MVGMYLRTTKRKNADGSTVVYYQLAHNVRDERSGASTAQILHNFGRADQIDPDDLRRLARSIGRVVGLEFGDPAQAEPADPIPAGVEQRLTRSLGVPLVVEALWKRLGIESALLSAERADNCKVRYERALLAMVANRLDDPHSKLGVCERWLDTVHVPSAWGLTPDQCYDALDLLHRHQADVERSVFFETANLLNLVVDLVFYDTTTASFAIDEPDPDGIRKFGHSKEADWRIQVVVALAVTREGIPVRSWVLPGNTTDVTTVQRVKDDLRDWKLGRVLFVGDSGMNSEDNRASLARACGKYVLACRPSSVKEVAEDVLTRPGRYREVRPNLRVKEVVVGDGEKRRRYVVCHNPERAAKERAHREQVVRELEEMLEGRRDRSSTRKWVAELRASGRYGRYVKLDSKGNLRLDRDAVADAERLDGKWVLITNDDTLSAEDVADAYHGSQVIERGFRTLKSEQIELRPMYHRLQDRIEAHVKLCVLALLICRVAERETGLPWMRIHTELAALQATEFVSGSHRFFRSNELSSGAADVLKALQVEPPKRVIAILPVS